MEETVERDKAVESACVVIALMQGGQHQVRRVPWPVERFSDFFLSGELQLSNVTTCNALS